MSSLCPANYNDVIRYPHGCSVVRSSTILAYQRIHKSDPVHRRCADALKSFMRNNPMQFYYQQESQTLTPQFQEIVDRYYKPFCEDFIDTWCILGVVPFCFVMLPNGVRVPQVLRIGTYDVVCYHSFKSESPCYDIYRVGGDGLGISEKGRKRIIDDCGNLSERPRKRTANLDIGNGLSYPAHNEDSDDDCEETGPTANDSRVNQARRVDLGLDFPGNNEPDPTCSVIANLGADIGLDGTVFSIVAASAQGYIAYETCKALDIMMKHNMVKYKPFLQPGPIASDYAQYMRTGRAMQTDVTQDPAVTNGMPYIVASQDQAFRKKQAADQDAQTRRGVSTLGVTNPCALGGAMGDLAAINALEQLKTHANMAMFKDGQTTPWCEIPSAGTMANAPPPFVNFDVEGELRRYEELVTNLYKLPISLYRNQASTQGNVDIQQDLLSNTEGQWIKILTFHVTRIYLVLNGDSDYENEVSCLYEKWVNESVIKRIAKEFELAARADKLQILRELVANGRLKRADFNPFANMEGIDELFNKPSKDRLYGKSGPRSFHQKWKSYKNMRFDRLVNAQAYELQNRPPVASNNASIDDIDALLGKNRKDAQSEPNPMLADMTIETLFLEALKKSSPETLRQMFKCGDVVKRNWFEKKSEKIRNRAEEDVYDDRDDVDRSPSIIVTFSASSSLSIKDIILLRMLHVLKKDEYFNMLRARANVPIQTDMCIHDYDVDPLEKFADVLESDMFDTLLQDTPLLPILQMSKENMKKHDQELVQKVQAEMNAMFAAQRAGEKEAENGKSKPGAAKNKSSTKSPEKKKEKAKPAKDGASKAKTDKNNKEKTPEPADSKYNEKRNNSADKKSAEASA